MTTTDQPSSNASGAAPARKHFATHGHHRLAFEDVPVDPTRVVGDVPTIVLLHALLAGRAEFAPLRGLLRDRARLILPDARGHGASAAIPDRRYTIRTAASELDAILDTAHVDNVHLLGHDFGGAVALAYAFVRPERIRSLTLIDPALPNLPDAPDPDGLLPESRRADARAADFAYKGVTERAVDEYLAPRLGPGWRDTAPKTLVGTIRRHGSALAGCLAALGDFAPDASRLDRLAIPVNVVITANARQVDRLVATELGRLLPTATTITLARDESPDASWPYLGGDAAAAIVDALPWLPRSR